MADINKLKAVIDADAYGLAWAGKDDATVAAEISTTLVPDVIEVAAGKVRLWALSAGADWAYGDILEDIKAGQTDQATKGNRGLCTAAFEFYKSEDPYIRADHGPLLALMVANGIVSQAQADALDSQADVTVTIAQKESLGRVFATNVAQARSI